MPANFNQQQVDIFQGDQRQRYFADLCNALYERELLVLSQQKNPNVSLLQRRLAGLSYHIKNLAERLLSNHSPLSVDIHNASWQAKQAAKSVASKIQPNETQKWFSHCAQLGMPVVVRVYELGIEHLEIDSVDRIDLEKSHLHVNKHGWFNFDGSPVEQDNDPQIRQQKLLLKPSKAIFTAACCGHSWNHKGRSQPRSLSLRELLLSTSINWKTFR